MNHLLFHVVSSISLSTYTDIWNQPMSNRFSFYVKVKTKCFVHLPYICDICVYLYLVVILYLLGVVYIYVCIMVHSLCGNYFVEFSWKGDLCICRALRCGLEYMNGRWYEFIHSQPANTYCRLLFLYFVFLCNMSDKW